MDINNPHDSIFKALQTKKENAADFMQTLLPADITEKLNLETLQIKKGSFIDEKLKSHYSDILYTCIYKNEKEITIALLFEHKSSPDQYPYIQLLRYMVRFWDECIKNKKQLMPIIPIIFYHGYKKWNKKPFTEYFTDIDELLEKFIPQFDYLLIDLNKYNNETIKNLYFTKQINKAYCLLAKNIFNDNNLYNMLTDIFTILQPLIKSSQNEDFISMLLYIFSATELTPENIKQKIEQTLPDGGKIIMTTAIKLINQGKELGIEQGIEQGIRKKAIIDAKKMKKKGYPIEDIIEITGLEKDEIEKL